MLLPLLAALAFPLLNPADNAALAHAPREIGRLLERRAECEHWAGEEPYDAARGEAIAHAETKLKCDHLDADAEALRLRYVHRPALMRLLRPTPL